MIVSLFADIVAPVAVYYVLRGLGFGEWFALLMGAIGPSAQACYTLLRKRTIDWPAIIVLTIIAAGIATSLISGSPRFLLAKDGLLTGAIAVALFASMLGEQPAMFMIGRMMVRSAGHSTGDWDHQWQHSERFRRIWHRLTALWGFGVLADAALRVVMAYTLPIDTVPALSTVLWLVLLVGLQAFSQIYLRRPNIKPLVFTDPSPSRGNASR